MKKITLFVPVLAALLVSGCSGGQQQNQNQANESENQENLPRIKADQIGYYVNSAKIAIIPQEGSDEFEIFDVKDQKTVYTGKTSESQTWDCSGTTVKTADFSDFKKQGIYYIKCKGTANSYPFAIGEDIYQDLAVKAVKSFYYARCSEEIKPEFAGKFARPAAHPDDSILIHKSAAGPKRKEGQVISSPGGWYDAGDYNKYIVNSAITVSELLNAVDYYPEYVEKLKTNIPESGNGLPDLVNELLVNLRWMTTMQDPDDGGVYHKLTALNFNGMIMPQDDHDQRYVIVKSTAAALDFTSTMIKAARVLKRYEDKLPPKFCDKLESRAYGSFNWAAKHRDVLFLQNPDDVKTGMYNDENISDEWTWTSLEMFTFNGDELNFQNIKKDRTNFTPPCWDSTGILGIISIFNDKQQSALLERYDNELYNYLKDGFLNLADKLYSIYEKSPYKTTLDVFPWGSNSECANQGIVLLSAYRITGNTKYLEAAQGNLHYILGRNPLDYCMVTGIGSNGVKNIHDRRSVADGIAEPIPGLLCGGPFANAGDDCGPENYPDKHPAMRYFDNPASYSTNEIAINWNAALCALVIGIEAEQGK